MAVADFLLPADAPARAGLREARVRRVSSRADRRLAAALRRRDPQALRTVHETYGGAVSGLLRSMLPDPATAEDVYQHVLTEVWTRGAGYEPERASVITWLLTIARSRALDELRRRVPEPLDPQAGHSREPRVPSADDELLERWRMAGLLRLLPAEDAEVLRLRFYAGLTQSEISDRTGIALGTVKTRMVRGLERLRALLDEEEARGAGPGRRRSAPAPRPGRVTT
jgi:RNA polymerase sigma-70 factor, ECF subfamily